MIVPDHWAEARRRTRLGKRQITVRRFGWSSTSEDDARAMAEARADDALARLLRGETLDRREPKVAYNGALGVPIREEVLARHGSDVITRNAYGAHCLNTEHALFADVDFRAPDHSAEVVTASVIGVALGGFLGLLAKSSAFACGVAIALPIVVFFLRRVSERVRTWVSGGPERRALERIRAFVTANPDWNLRVYRTPAGLRLLATHRPFDAAEDEVSRFFEAIDADPIYVFMCQQQRCFRARLTAKPWRIGIATHLRPRPGVWPVNPERMPERSAWIAAYETAASRHAACHYVESIGSGRVDASVRDLMELHDRESRARETELPLA